MRILVFSWRGPKHPTAGGAEQVMHEHMKGWVKAGHSVTLFTSRIRNKDHSYSKSKETIDGVRIIRKSCQYLGVQFFGFIYYLRNKSKYDLIVDQFHGIPFFTPLYVKKPILAVVQEVAGKVWLKNDFPFPYDKIIGMIGYLSEPFIFKFYKKVFFMTGSESARDDILKMGIPKENISIIHHGVIVEKPKPFPRKEKSKTVMFLGAISRDKGIEDVLKVFSLLNKQGEYKFWIVGKASGPYIDLIDNLSEKYGIKKNLTFFGFVDQKTKFELLARAHLTINPSLLEGWGLVNIEANAMGTPVIAYRSRGLIDSVRDRVSGILCQKNDPKVMAKATARVLGDEKLYRSLRVGALDWANKFNWKSSVKESLTLIEGII